MTVDTQVALDVLQISLDLKMWYGVWNCGYLFGSFLLGGLEISKGCGFCHFSLEQSMDQI